MRGTNTTWSDLMEELDDMFDLQAIRSFILDDIQIYHLPGDLGNRTAQAMSQLESGLGVRMELRALIIALVDK